ncbi:MAG: AAA family ATPase, partial [SAR202 cluster bacterium]|nr:AAA family ATPase [SAR202 cluster bacterium]
VFDIGEHEGQPFMVQELMGGGDVERVVEDAEGGKLPLKQAISIAVETCRGLEFAHSRGIVHRDLKPGNVWLTADGIAKIGDFGLAVATDRSRLTTEGMMVGTVSYMPPEQAMGGEVTPKADLYSLGAMLYEMVCGRPPFLGDDSISIIGQHINTPPVAPTWHRADCPRPLEALTMRLLAKDPSERPQSAADVLAALESIDLTGTAEASTPPAEQESNVLDSLAGDIFVGRQREMDDLKAALEDTLGGRGRMVTLVGEPGIGKTRTSQELATYAGLRGCQVLWGRCYEEQGVPPYWPWVQAIRSYVREQDPEKLNSVMGSGAADIAEVITDVRDKLPGLPKPQQIDDPESARFKLFDAITAFLKSASLARPLVLILDDLHWSDKPSLMLLQFLVRELSGARILLIGTYRDMELNRQHPLADSLAILTRERLFERVLLRGLSRDDVGRFIEVTSGVTPPSSLVDTVYAQTEGSPLFVTEVVRLLVQEGQLTPDRTSSRETWTLRIPEGVREVIGRRLNRLSARCNEALAVASVIGREFNINHLSPLMDDLSSDRLLDVLEEGLEARVIEELPTGIGLYQFTHALIHETLLDELSLTRRVRLHTRVAESLESLYGANADDHAAELAYHFVQAEAVLGGKKIVHYCQVAGDRALQNYAYEEALEQFERAIASREDEQVDAQAANLYFGLAQAQTATIEAVRFDVALPNLSMAFDFYEETENIERAVAVAAHQFLGPPGLLADALDLTTRALKLAVDGSVETGHVLARHGFILGREIGDYEQGIEALDDALSIARNHGERTLEARALYYSAHIEASHLKYRQCLEKSIEAQKLAREVGDTTLEARCLWETAATMSALGDSKRCLEITTDALKIAEELRNSSFLGDVLWIRARLSVLLGEYDNAREHAERVMEFAPNDTRLIRMRGILEFQTGNFQRGKSHFDKFSATRGSVAASSLPNSFMNLQSMLAVDTGERVTITGELELLEVISEIAIQLETSPVQVPWYMVPARLGVGLAASINGNAESAREQYDALLPYGGTLPRLSEILIDRVLGNLAHTMGDRATAATHYENGIAFCRNAGYRPQLAWTLHDYANMLLDTDKHGIETPSSSTQHLQAMAMLDEALEISRDTGMRPLMERVLSRREILKA